MSNQKWIFSLFLGIQKLRMRRWHCHLRVSPTDQSYTKETLRSVTWTKILTSSEDIITFTAVIQNYFCHGENSDSRPIPTHPHPRGAIKKKKNHS